MRLTSDGQEAKQPARLEALPAASRRLVRLFVEARLLVSGKGADGDQVEIAHEALLRTWPKLVGWIEKGREALRHRQRVRRLAEALSADAPEGQRRQALQHLAALAAAGGSEADAVRLEAHQPLDDLLQAAAPVADRKDAALVLALIGAEEPLRLCLANPEAPVALRRRAAESLGLLARRCGSTDPQAIKQCQRIEAELEGWLSSEDVNLLVSDEAGWLEHDQHVSLLQGASQAIQLVASADLPLIGSGPRRSLPMLTLTALKGDAALRIRTEVLNLDVWRLPLPGGEQLELVVVPGGEFQIGSPESEDGRGWYATRRDGCSKNKGVNVEAERTVRLARFAMARHPITQVQWRAVAELLPKVEQELNSSPGSFFAKGLWETHAQPGALPVDSISWNDCQEWLKRLNHWLSREWSHLGGQGPCPQLVLPSESQWEAACRSGTSMPFFFGDVLDANWATFDGGYTYGPSRKGKFRSRPVSMGYFGLVNRWGLADMHGQVWEWCGDQWHPDPTANGWPSGGQAWEGVDPALEASDTHQKNWRVLRGGSWYHDPQNCRTAFRFSYPPDGIYSDVGFRPCCHLSPDSPLDA